MTGGVFCGVAVVSGIRALTAIVTIPIFQSRCQIYKRMLRLSRRSEENLLHLHDSFHIAHVELAPDLLALTITTFLLNLSQIIVWSSR